MGFFSDLFGFNSSKESTKSTKQKPQSNLRIEDFWDSNSSRNSTASKGQQSAELFKKAVAMKRQGNFSEAIRLQKESIRIYPEDPELPNNYYSMAKTFYLMGDYDSAISSYMIYTGMCMMANSAILNDFQKSQHGDNYAAQRFVASFSNVARHIGHALDKKMNPQQSNEGARYYHDELMGKNAAGYSDANSAYGEKCRVLGFRAVEAQCHRFLENFQREKNLTMEVARAIAGIVG